MQKSKLEFSAESESDMTADEKKSTGATRYDRNGGDKKVFLKPCSSCLRRFFGLEKIFIFCLCFCVNFRAENIKTSTFTGKALTNVIC